MIEVVLKKLLSSCKNVNKRIKNKNCFYRIIKNIIYENIQCRALLFQLMHPPPLPDFWT